MSQKCSTIVGGAALPTNGYPLTGDQHMVPAMGSGGICLDRGHGNKARIGLGEYFSPGGRIKHFPVQVWTALAVMPQLLEVRATIHVARSRLGMVLDVSCLGPP